MPEALLRVQLWGIGRQAFQVEALRRAVGQERFDGVAAVDRRAIPDEDHPAGHLPQQVLEKRDHGVSVDGAVLAVEVELALGRDGADSGEMVVGAPLPQNGRLAHRRLGAHDTGQGIESGIVSEEDGLPLGLRPLLRAGQISSRQWAIAASLRCRSRRIGFWGLQWPAPAVLRYPALIPAVIKPRHPAESLPPASTIWTDTFSSGLQQFKARMGKMLTGR
jgi:hypothetical protein